MVSFIPALHRGRLAPLALAAIIGLVIAAPGGTPSTVAAADYQWQHSPTHNAILMSTSYNYVGVGLAVDPATGKKVWTADYLRGPDRTGARATVYTPKVVAGPTASTRYANLSWTGY